VGVNQLSDESGDADSKNLFCRTNAIDGRGGPILASRRRKSMLILVTGATGKVGRNLIARLVDDPRFSKARIRALCHSRLCEETDRVAVMRGSIADRATVAQALSGVTHVVHLATCKETPDAVMDVAVKGLFWLLEEFRSSATARQFILIGGDAAVGHFHYRHDGPITEKTPHRAYPGCYALSKVLEEVMLEQFGIQYDTDGCCLRAPWIMEKDDFKYTLSFGDDVFGGPDWKTLVPEADARRYAERGTVPLLRDADGRPLKRNFVHVDDLVSAILAAIDNPRARRQLFNICMDRPVDYGEVAAYLALTRGLDCIDIPSRFHSNWMDNGKARELLDWQPDYDLEKLVDSAWTYERSQNDPRIVWYPG
jgi:nucleoside-diphosphate-sugar epimerase